MIAGLLVLLLAALLAATAALGGPRILAALIVRAGTALGYQEVAVDVDRVGLQRTVLAAISAGPAPGLRAEGVILEYDWRSLARARLRRVRIENARLNGSWNEDGMVFPALPPAREGPWIAVPAWEQLEVGKGAVALGGARGPVTLSFADFEAQAPPGERLSAKGIASIDSQAPPIDAEFDLVLDGPRLLGSARVHSRDGKLDLRAAFGDPGEDPGRFPAMDDPGELRLDGQVTVKAKEADLSPVAPAFTANGTVRFASEGGRLQVRSDGLDLSVLGLSVGGLAVSLDLEQLLPPVGGSGQRLSVDTARMGVPLGGGSVRFAVRPSGVVEIEALDWRLHGGTLHTAAAIDPNADENALALAVEQVDLASLIAGLGREDLDMTGRVSGSLPLRLAGDRIFADGGRLMAIGDGGVIRYRPGGEAPAADAPAQPKSGSVGGMGLVLDALRNFHYRTLEVGVQGELTGEMDLQLKIEGSNPDVYDGYPFQINLNLEGPLADVVRGSQTGFRVQDAVEERFQKRREKR